jgi:hypothetical protein
LEGKANDVNAGQRNKFRAWLERQKHDGEFYSIRTINNYITNLKNITAKMELGKAVSLDLFSYTTLKEFEAAHKIILASPKFYEVDILISRRSYSNGMKKYRQFLAEQSKRS